MKQKLDEVRTLAVKLFEAWQAEKRRQAGSLGWGSSLELRFRHISSKGAAVWDAVAIAAFKHFKK